MERDEILSKLRERIVAFAASKISREAAEDLAQEVLLILHEKYDQVRELHELLPLSFQILRFKLLDYQRKAYRRGEYNQVPIEDLPLSDPKENPGAAVERKELLERLLTAIGQLKPRCRQMLRWKLEGKTFSQIQDLLGVDSINTVYTWDFRCRKELLDLLGGSWDEPAPGRELAGVRRREPR